MSQQPFNRVSGLLYMGSAPPPHPRWGDHADVITFCAIEYQPDATGFPHVAILRCPIDDAIPSEAESLLALQTARTVASALRRGDRVLVTCQMGWNRSGLVSALALYLRGIRVSDAIAKVRDARGPHALSNGHFVRMLQRLPPTLPNTGTRLRARP